MFSLIFIKNGAFCMSFNRIDRKKFQLWKKDEEKLQKW